RCSPTRSACTATPRGRSTSRGGSAPPSSAPASSWRRSPRQSRTTHGIPDMQIRPSGTHGLLLEFDSLDEVLAHYAALKEEDLPVLDLVPAGRTILAVVDRDTDLPSLASRLSAVHPGEHTGHDGTLVEVPVRYDGADLADAADLLGCSPEELARRHQEEEWTVAFGGFAPGFGYLAGSRFSWDVPRRPNPRTRVPAGSLALA